MGLFYILIHTYIHIQRHREAQLRDLVELICERIVHFAIFTIVVLVATGATQAYYLQSYFKRKKII
jgi:hypothetical protein